MADRVMDTYALLADGTTVEIRLATPEDFDAVKAMHAAMSPDNIYLRFFSFSPLSAENEAERVCRDGMWLEQNLFLGSHRDVDDVLEAFEKVKEFSPALLDCQQLAGTSRQ